MKWRTFLAMIGALVLTAGVAGGLGYWKWKGIQKAMRAGPPPEFPEAVVLATVESRPYQRSFQAVGTIQAIRHITVATEVSGKVAHVGYESGQTIEEGAVILRLDTSTEEADLRAAEALVRLNQATLDRYEQVSANAISKQEVDRVRAELDQSRARVEQLKTTIAKKEIRAPFAGKLGMRDVQPGQYLAQGETITTLQGTSDEVYVDFSVPQLQAAGIPVGGTVSVMVAGREVTARVIASDPRIDMTTRNARVRAIMPSMGGRLTPGMFVDVRIPLGEAEEVLTIPPTAVRYAPFGSYTFVVEPDPKDAKALRVHQRFIKAAGSTGGRVIIQDGLKAGERVAADGAFKLREGALVFEPPAGMAGAGVKEGVRSK